jgi:hypothetical protein
VRENPTAEHFKWLFAIDHDLRWLRDSSRLLLQSSVQKELALSQDQARKITQLAERRREVFREQHDVTPEEWRAKLDKLADQETALIRELGAQQQKRLEQIAWQQARASAFSDPKVVAALHLTAGQMEQIRAIQGEGRRGPRGGPRPPSRRPEAAKRAEDHRSSTLEQAQNVLTAEQKEQWALLIGEPFKGDIRHGPVFDFGLRPSRNPRRPPWPGPGRPGD